MLSVLTFNVEGQRVNPLDLSGPFDNPKTNIVAICLQEARSTIPKAKNQKREAEWDRLAYKYVAGIGKESFGSRDIYVGQALFIFKRKGVTVTLARNSKNQTNVVARYGAGKASVGMALNIPATRFKPEEQVLIICSHFPFQADDLQGGQGLKARETMAAQTFQAMRDGYPSITNWIWAGDLNFRIDYSSLASERAEELLETWLSKSVDNPVPAAAATEILVEQEREQTIRDFLVEMDQLNRIKQRNTKLRGFTEGVQKVNPPKIGIPPFAPTCKLDTSRSLDCHTTPELSCFKTKSKSRWWSRSTPRWPSWCDRILYIGDLLCLKYERIDQILSGKQSDHASVWALFDFSPSNKILAQFEKERTTEDTYKQFLAALDKLLSEEDISCAQRATAFRTAPLGFSEENSELNDLIAKHLQQCQDEFNALLTPTKCDTREEILPILSSISPEVFRSAEEKHKALCRIEERLKTLESLVEEKECEQLDMILDEVATITNEEWGAPVRERIKAKCAGIVPSPAIRS